MRLCSMFGDGRNLQFVFLGVDPLFALHFLVRGLWGTISLFWCTNNFGTRLDDEFLWANRPCRHLIPWTICGSLRFCSGFLWLWTLVVLPAEQVCATFERLRQDFWARIHYIFNHFNVMKNVDGLIFQRCSVFVVFLVRGLSLSLFLTAWPAQEPVRKILQGHVWNVWPASGHIMTSDLS